MVSKLKPQVLSMLKRVQAYRAQKLLKAIGTSFGDDSDELYHLMGDKFVVQARSEEEAHAIMTRVREHLRGARLDFEMPDGRIASLDGLELSYGVGRDYREADHASKPTSSSVKRSGYAVPVGRRLQDRASDIVKQGGKLKSIVLPPVKKA